MTEGKLVPEKPVTSATSVATFFTPGDAADSEYVFVRDSEYWEAHRAEIERRLQRFLPVCGDGEFAFLSDARTHGRQRLWEMQVACMMLDAGHALQRPPRDAPDVLCQLTSRRAWIEATVAGRGTGPDAVDPPDEGMVFIDRDRMILRYTNALHAKVTQYDEFRTRSVGGQPIISPDDAYVIALNASEIPNADIQGEIPDIVRAVFGLGRQKFVVPVRGRKVPVPSKWPTCVSISKRSGAAVATTMFLADCAPAVSAVLFTAVSPWTMRTDDYKHVTIVHNPWARVPLPRGALGVGREWWLDREAEQLCSDR